MNFNPDIPNHAHSPAMDNEDNSRYSSDKDFDLLLAIMKWRWKRNVGTSTSHWGQQGILQAFPREVILDIFYLQGNFLTASIDLSSSILLL